MEAIILALSVEKIKKILSGELRIEIQKTIPKCKLPVTVYVYCREKGDPIYIYHDTLTDIDICGIKLNGNIVAKFTLSEIDEYSKIYNDVKIENSACYYKTKDSCIIDDARDLVKYSCMTYKEIVEYGKGGKIYAWHIDNLVVFDIPKELNEIHLKGFLDYEDWLIWVQQHVQCSYEEWIKNYELQEVPKNYSVIDIKTENWDIFTRKITERIF